MQRSMRRRKDEYNEGEQVENQTEDQGGEAEVENDYDDNENHDNHDAGHNNSPGTKSYQGIHYDRFWHITDSIIYS